MHLRASLANGDVCLDLHLSMVGFDETDRRVFEEGFSTVQIIEVHETHCPGVTMTMRGSRFDLIAALVFLPFLLFVRHRVRAFAEKQEALRADPAPLRGFLLPAFSVFPLVRATLQHLGGFEDPFFHVHGDLSNPAVFIV